MNNSKDAIAFYEDCYQATFLRSLRTGDREFLGDKASRKCRFCGRTHPGVSFRKEAHALPEGIGNKSLFTYYECDACNHAFGIGCEDDFGKWSLPMRTMARIGGKNGIPTLRQGPNGTWRIGKYEGGLSLSLDETEGFYEDDETNKILRLHLCRGPYRPLMVVQAMVKMALSIMPEEEMPNFQRALAWIKPENQPKAMYGPTPFFYTSIPGPAANDLITVAILTRRRDDLDTPYAFILLRYGYEMLQMAIPSPERDKYFLGKLIDLTPYPAFTHGVGAVPANAKCILLPFFSTEIVRDDSFAFDVQYGEKVSVNEHRPWLSI